MFNKDNRVRIQVQVTYNIQIYHRVDGWDGGSMD